MLTRAMLSPFIVLPLGSRRVISFPYKACGCVLTPALKTATWIGSLPFNGHLCFRSGDFCASSEMKHNLFEYTTTSLNKGPMKFIVRSSPLLYPIVGGFGKDSGGQKLITDLCQPARSHGNCALISNGSSAKACKDQCVFLCSNGHKYHHHLEGAEANSYCCVTTYIV